MTGSITAVPVRDPAPQAAALYRGVVMHARLKPIVHRFTYRVTSLAIDLDRLAEADAQSALFSVNRRNLVAFHEADHGPGDGTPLRPWVDALLHDAGGALAADARPSSRDAGEGAPRSGSDEGGRAARPLSRSEPWSHFTTSLIRPSLTRGPPSPASREKVAAGRIILLCYPRLLGYVFNPLSVYYCYDEAGSLAALVYEVRNTFGERHAYVVPVRAGEASQTGIRQECRKLFHVSPFLGMELRYKFRLRAPAETVAVRILEYDEGGPILAATFYGRRSPLGTAALLRAFGAVPLQSLKIIAGIHWEALKLWLKGARYHARPLAPAHASVDGRMIDER